MAYPAGLGNGTGFIYLVAPNGTDILSSFRNDTVGRERVLVLASGPKTSRTSSTVSYSTTLSLSGNRIFLYDDAAAVEGVLGAATEITDLVMVRASTNAMAHIAATLAANTISITRTSNLATVALSTEGGAPTDQLDTITYSELINGDRLILYGPSGGQVTTVASGAGNIFLTGGTSFVTSTSTNQLELRYWNAGGGVATGWYEIGRSVVFPTVANQRTQNVAVGIQGTTSTAMPTSGTTTFTANSNKEYQIITGNPGLVGNVAYAVAAAAVPVEGDEFWLDYRATPTLGGFTVTLFGILLTTTQATGGLLVAYSRYNGATWDSWIIPKTNLIDFATTTQLATKENSLGNPAADGYVLASTAAGVRSWSPPANNPVLYNTTANNQTTAIITEEILKTYSLAASTMDVNGDLIEIEAIYQTAATANAKTVTLYFGATAIGTITGAFNADTILVKATVNRIGATTQSAYCQIFVFDTAAPGTLVAQSVQYTLPGETLSGAVSINFAATNGVAAAGDIISRQASVRLFQKL